jgi:multiple sugar transport system substrate-binding protein
MPAPWKLPGNRQTLGLPLVVAPLLLLLAGCPDTEPGDTTPEGALPQNAELRLLVVDDPALAAAVGRAEGEWNALTGSGFQVDQISQEELEGAEALEADAVIAASCLVGQVQAQAEIVPVPPHLVEDDRDGWSDLFSLLRVREAVWGKQVVGVPFGSPVLVVYYRADLLEKLGRQPPRTWAEYGELAALLADRSRLGEAAGPPDAPWHGAAEPLGPGWAGLVLLARAAPYASHRENYSTIFRIDSMEPLIDGPPYVRALEELVAAAASGPPEQLAYDPAAVRDAFWSARCGLALTWPSAASRPSPDGPSAESGFSVGLAELPGSSEAYDVAEGRWEPRRGAGEQPDVPLLGTAGRMGWVLGTSRWPEPAFQLLFWLSDEQAPRVGAASPATTLFRGRQVQSPTGWVEEPMPADAAARYAQMTQATLCRPQWLFALRIPGRRQYLAALDAAVHRTVRGEQTPDEALGEAARDWQKITTELGPEQQREAYWSSLGLE